MISKFILTSFLPSLFFCLWDFSNKELVDTKWVMVKYTDPDEQKEVSIHRDSYEKGCEFKFIIQFSKNGRLSTRMNDKFTSVGRYEKQGNNFTYIRPRINLNIYDKEEKCHLDTKKRIVFGTMLMNARSYEITDDKLMIHYFIKDKNTKGIVEFTKVASVTE